MTVRLHIERLVVDGLELDRADGARLAAALETKLGEHLSAHSAADWSSFAVPALPLDGFTAAGQGGVEDLGCRIADIIHQGLKR